MSVCLFQGVDRGVHSQHHSQQPCQLLPGQQPEVISLPGSYRTRSVCLWYILNSTTQYQQQKSFERVTFVCHSFFWKALYLCFPVKKQILPMVRNFLVLKKHESGCNFCRHILLRYLLCRYSIRSRRVITHMLKLL
jgi:hypothetical protein